MIRRKTNKFESRKLTLEERISRLERALTSNRKSRRFEGARPAVMMAICNQVQSMLMRRLDLDMDDVSVMPDTVNDAIKVVIPGDINLEYTINVNTLTGDGITVVDDQTDLALDNSDNNPFEDISEAVEAIAADAELNWQDA